MQQRHIITLLLLVQLVAALLLAQPVQAADSGLVSGSVFVDNNGNDLAEPQEARVLGATVHIRSSEDPAFAATVQTDGSGYFLLSNVPYGVYDVWATVDGQSGQRLLTIEVAEVNAQVLLDVPVSAAVAGVRLVPSTTLYLPLVTSAE